MANDPSLIDQLTKPLEAVACSQMESHSVLADDVLPAPLDEPYEHYVNELDSQTSFLDLDRGGVVGAEEIDVVLGDPYPVIFGQKYLLCERHYLLVEAIVEPPQSWKYLLVDNRVFIPWPDVFSADIFHTSSPPVVMVQPDRYIAGVILNYYVHKYGSDAVRPVS